MKELIFEIIFCHIVRPKKNNTLVPGNARDEGNLQPGGPKFILIQ